MNRREIQWQTKIPAGLEALIRADVKDPDLWKGDRGQACWGAAVAILDDFDETGQISDGQIRALQNFANYNEPRRKTPTPPVATITPPVVSAAPAAPSQWLELKDVASHIGVSDSWIYSLIRRGLLTSRRSNRGLLVDMTAVEDLYRTTYRKRHRPSSQPAPNGAQGWWARLRQWL